MLGWCFFEQMYQCFKLSKLLQAALCSTYLYPLSVQSHGLNHVGGYHLNCLSSVVGKVKVKALKLKRLCHAASELWQYC